jgi:hypothetical protein
LEPPHLIVSLRVLHDLAEWEVVRLTFRRLLVDSVDLVVPEEVSETEADLHPLVLSLQKLRGLEVTKATVDQIGAIGYAFDHDLSRAKLSQGLCDRP